jgi:hypothetical protein
MAVEHFGRTPHSEIVDDAGFGEAQAGHVAAEAQKLRDRADLAADIGRSAEQPFLQQPDDRLELLDVPVVSGSVRLQVSHDLAARQPAASGQQIIAVAGQEIVGLSEHDLEAMPFELEVPDHLRIEQADRVAGRRVPEARQEFVGHRGAADIARRFQDGDPHALLRQIISASQAIVTRANHDRIEIHHSPGLVKSRPIVTGLVSSSGTRICLFLANPGPNLSSIGKRVILVIRLKSRWSTADAHGDSSWRSGVGIGFGE